MRKLLAVDKDFIAAVTPDFNHERHENHEHRQTKSCCELVLFASCLSWLFVFELQLDRAVVRALDNFAAKNDYFARRSLVLVLHMRIKA